MLMESSRCLEDNIVETPMEVDMGLIYGLGFPPFRGGIFRWADNVGLNEIIQRAEKHNALGKVYEPTEQIRKMAQEGQLFHPVKWAVIMLKKSLINFTVQNKVVLELDEPLFII